MGDAQRARGARASGCRRTARSWRRTACASAPSTTWRCSRRWASARASRTTRGSSTAGPPGSPPHTLIDYFPDDFVMFIDESHQTVPQIGGMYEGDRSRKQTLVDYGFRLPSAMDNRPLRFDEFLQRVPQMVFVSATPGPYEREHSTQHRRADRAPDRHRRPGGRGARDQAPDRRPDERDQGPRRGQRARAGHDAHQEDGRGPHRLPARVRLPRALPALRDRHDRADPDHPRPAPRRVRRAGRREPAARGPRPARGVAGRRSSTPTRRASCAGRPA